MHMVIVDIIMLIVDGGLINSRSKVGIESAVHGL